MSLNLKPDMGYISESVGRWWNSLNNRQRLIYLNFNKYTDMRESTFKFSDLSESTRQGILQDYLDEAKKNYDEVEEAV